MRIRTVTAVGALTAAARPLAGLAAVAGVAVIETPGAPITRARSVPSVA